jgi:hypothetical protein
MRILILSLPFLAASCVFPVQDPVTSDTMAKCYSGMTTSFCVANTPPGTSMAQGQGVLGALMYGLQGMVSFSFIPK